MLLRVALFLLSASALLAQTKGTINGDVIDATGAAIPGAKLKVRAVAIGLVREAATNESGFFTVPNLPAADYEVSVEASGFKSLVRPGIRLDTDAVVSLKLQLEVGQLTERVEVTAETPTVDVSEGEVSRLLNANQMQN